MARNLWRVCFVLGAVGILAGGPLHPGGTMEEMLAHPDWFRSHALILAGFVAMAIGLVLYGRIPGLPVRTEWWRRAAIIGCVLQSIEMAFHTAAMVDHDKLVAGASTPVLTTHLWMTALLYPIFAVTIVGFIVAAARDGVLGSWWIAWLGIAGALAHGAAGPLVVIWELEWARELFPLIVLVAIWFVIAACWPVRPPRAGAALRTSVLLLTFVLTASQAHAQGRDSLLNGIVIGAAVGAGAGVAFTHAVRDSDLGFDQYAYGALVFGAIGAGAGLGIDALLNRTSPAPTGTGRRMLIVPAVWRNVAGVAVKWRW